MTQKLPYIREVVVVEGKDDVSAVKRACHAQTIITSGLGISREIIRQIQAAQQRCGVIILTDPDAPGDRIRGIINKQVPGCKQAYIYQEKTQRSPGRTVLSKASGHMNRSIGVEYAQPEEILAALREAKATVADKQNEAFTTSEMLALGLAGGENAGEKRDWLAKRLGIGKANGKQFLRRLNAYDVSKDEFAQAYREMMDRYGTKG
ncbi:MAG: ribonuclease M5 [Clostridiales bacterium]|nr:ribonuclease M5 [Clostridiales bacterium]